MRSLRCGNMLCATIAEFNCVQTCKKVLTGTDKGWSNGQVHLVDESSAKVLPNRCDPTAKPNISSIGNLCGAFQRGMNALRGEVKCRAAVHRDCCTRVIRQHEDRHVIWRVLAPPAFPGVVG